MVMQPSICIFAPVGLITRPMSCAATMRFTWIAPVFLSTATSAQSAQYVPASTLTAIARPCPEGPAAGFQPNASAAVVERGDDADDRRRSERVEEELLAARPRHHDRLAGDLREARRLDGLPGRALPAEAAADERRDHADLALVEPQALGDARARAER